MRAIRRGLSGLALVVLFSLSILSDAVADSHRSFDQRLQAAMDDPGRPAKDRARDANRLPRETLSFFGIRSDMRVLELLPGGGWYTRLLAPALSGSGELHLAFAARLPKEVREAPFMQGVEILEVDAPFEPTETRGIFEVPAFDFGVRNLDAVLTFRNLHNLTPSARAHMNRAAFDALSPGGVYGVIDHTRRHNQPDEGWNWRRLDPVRMIEEIQAAGFVLEAASDLHYRSSDALAKEVGEPGVSGRSDRFTLRFRKPAR